MSGNVQNERPYRLGCADFTGRSFERFPKSGPDNRRQGESNQTCLNCRGAKEEGKPTDDKPRAEDKPSLDYAEARRRKTRSTDDRRQAESSAAQQHTNACHIQILFQTPHPPNFVFFVSRLNAYLWGKEEETAPQRGFIFHFQALTAIRTAPAGPIPVASGLMRVRTFLMISFREGLLACFFTSSASAHMVFQLFSNFFCHTQPHF